MTRAEFLPCLAVLEAGCCTPIPTTTVDVWYSVLGDLPVEGLQAAVTRILSERTYPGLPPVGQLRQHAVEFIYGRIATPEEAFARMRQGLSKYGARITQEEREKLRNFVGQSIWNVVQGIGGWQRISDSSTRDRAVLYSQFRDAWMRETERRRMERSLPYKARPSVTHDPSAQKPVSLPRITVGK